MKVVSSNTMDIDKKNIIFVGETGVGKSSLTEKLSGFSNISSNSNFSSTNKSKAYESDIFCIVDTPGYNSIQNTDIQNMWTAEALTCMPYHLILIVVEASVRIENTITRIDEALNRFEDFETHICFIITYMDTVSWSADDFLLLLYDNIGEYKVLFSDINKRKYILESQIKNFTLSIPIECDITKSSFQKAFPINNNNFKVTKIIQNELTKFRSNCDRLSNLITNISDNQGKIDCSFYSKEFLENEIIEARKRLIYYCDFTMFGEKEGIELGHCKNLENQLSKEMTHITVLTNQYQKTIDTYPFIRKCTCGEVWYNNTGCNTPTMCGNPVEKSFTISDFTIKVNESKIKFGCGKEITWNNMIPIILSIEDKNNISCILSYPEDRYNITKQNNQGKYIIKSKSKRNGKSINSKSSNYSKDYNCLQKARNIMSNKSQNASKKNDSKKKTQITQYGYSIATYSNPFAVGNLYPIYGPYDPYDTYDTYDPETYTYMNEYE